MFEVVETDATFTTKSGAEGTPVVTLAGTGLNSGARAQIAYDDGCVVLYLAAGAGPYRQTTHWFTEAVLALRQLPVPE